MAGTSETGQAAPAVPAVPQAAPVNPAAGPAAAVDSAPPAGGDTTPAAPTSKRFWWFVLVVPFLVASYLVLRSAVGSSPTTGQKVAFGDVTALLVLVTFTAVLGISGWGPGGLVIGVDKRVSTSKVQVLLWTYAIGAVLLSLIASSWVGLSSGLDVITKAGFDFGPYLVLLGGPFLAAVGARALVGSQVSNGETVKPPAEAAKPSQVVTDDGGSTDLVDSQYLLFNLVALGYFLGAFIGNPQAGFPAIPALLYALTGASALGYVTNKAIPSGAPAITSMLPTKVGIGGVVTIFGSSLLFPVNPTQVQTPTDIEDFQEFHVLVGGVEATVVDGELSSTNSGGDRIKVKVPDLAPGTYDVVVLNFAGSKSESAQLEVTT